MNLVWRSISLACVVTVLAYLAASWLSVYNLSLLLQGWINPWNQGVCFTVGVKGPGLSIVIRGLTAANSLH